MIRGEDDFKINWIQKIKAFLYNPPESALYLLEGKQNRVSQRRQECWGTLGLEKQEEGIIQIQEADSIAYGLNYSFSTAPLALTDKLVFTHPLSKKEEEYEIDKIYLKEAKEAVDDAIKTISEFSNDPPKIFLALWRLLPEELSKKNPDWALMPVNPSTSWINIWDHASTRSALVSTSLKGVIKPSFLLFNLASVQDFVSTARRTQDFWMSSFLFSYLTWQAMKAIADKVGPDCILIPNLREQPLVDLWLRKKGINVLKPSSHEVLIGNFPNIFTALVPEDKATSLAEAACKAIEEERRNIFRAVKRHIEEILFEDGNLRNIAEELADKTIRKRELQGKIKSTLPGKIKSLSTDKSWNDLWKRQEEDFLEENIFWITYPWRPQNEGVKAIISDYKRLLCPDKTTTSFFNIFNSFLAKVKDKDSNIGVAYPLLFALVGRFLATRKNLRDFSQVREEANKCSLCGLREALHPEWISEDGDHFAELRIFWEVLSQARQKGKKLRGRIRRGERLCAVCSVKRLALEGYFKDYFKKEHAIPIDHHQFPSTSSVATARFKEALIRNIDKVKSELKDYVQKTLTFLEKTDIFYLSPAVPRLKKLAGDLSNNFKKVAEELLKIDGDWLYPESFDVQSIAREYGILDQDVNDTLRKAAQEALQKLLDKVAYLHKNGEIDVEKPARYLALLYMDVDYLGEWLRGRMNSKRPLTPTYHAALSVALRNFALKVTRQVVEECYAGKLIHAGGDDVLALVPLSNLFTVMRKLCFLLSGESQKRYGNEIEIVKPGFLKMKEDRVERLYLMAGSSLTASMGVVIAHRTHPLSHLVEEAGKALREDAKEGLGKDAFSVRLFKRSGEPLFVGAKWRYNGFDVCEMLSWIVAQFKLKNLSPRLIYDMKREALTFDGLAKVPNIWQIMASEVEFKRVVRRHVRKEDLRTEIVGKLANFLKSIREGQTGWARVINLLILAEFIERES